MTSVFSADGTYIPCTVIEAGPCVVTQVKTKEKDGYCGCSAGFRRQERKKHTTKAEAGHFKKSGTSPKRNVMEFRHFEQLPEVGSEIKADLFAEGDFVDVVGTSKGRGFQGVVKRHGFSGVGMQTHGQHNRLRAPGSRGASSFPSRVWPGQRTAGHMGVARVKMQNLQVVKVLPEQNIPRCEGCCSGT